MQKVKPKREGYAVGEYLVIEKKGPKHWVIQHLPSNGLMPGVHHTRKMAKRAADRLLASGVDLTFTHASNVTVKDVKRIVQCLK